MSEHNADPAEGAPPAGEPPAESSRPAKSIDYEQRFKATQADLTRRSQENAELRRRLAEYETDEAEPDDGGEIDDGEPAPPRPPVSSRFRATEPPRPQVPEPGDAAELGREIASAVHGPDVVADFDRAMELFEKATTTADRVTAFATFAELRNRAAPRRSLPAEGVQLRDQAVTPRVETNRPDDAGYSSEVDASQFAAGANGGVGGWVRELLGARRGPR